MAVSLRKILLLGAAAVGTASAAIMATPSEVTPARSYTKTHVTILEKRACQTYTFAGPAPCLSSSCSQEFLTTSVCDDVAPYPGATGTQFEITTATDGKHTGSWTYTGKQAATVSVPNPSGLAEHPAQENWTFQLTDELKGKIIDALNDACANSGQFSPDKVRRDPGTPICNVQQLGALEAGYGYDQGPDSLVLLFQPIIIAAGGVGYAMEVGQAYARRAHAITNIRGVLATVAAVAMVYQLGEVGYLTNQLEVPPNIINDVIEDSNNHVDIPDAEHDGGGGNGGGSEEEGKSCPIDATINPDDDQGQDGNPPDDIQNPLGGGGSAPETCATTILAPTPICTLTRQSNNPYRPSQQCLCPDNGSTRTVSASTSTITTCDGNGSGTHIDVCPWTTPPPTSMDVPICQTSTQSGFCTPTVRPKSWNLPETTPSHYCACSSKGMDKAELYYPSTAVVEVCSEGQADRVSKTKTLVCPYTTTPPTASKISFPAPATKTYAGGEYPEVNVLKPFCNKFKLTDYGKDYTNGYSQLGLEEKVKDFCKKAADRNDEFGPDDVERSMYRHYVMKGSMPDPNKNGEIVNQAFPEGPKAENVALFAHYEEKACPVGDDTKVFKFKGNEAKCQQNLIAAAVECKSGSHCDW